MTDDRRATLEAAFDAAEEGLQPAAEAKPVEAPVVETTSTLSSSGEAETTSSQLSNEAEAAEPPKTESSDETPAPKEEAAEVVPKAVNTDRPPQAWKAAQKAKWETLPQDVRQEVLRREHETTKVLNETAQVRQFATQFQQAIQPYMARIQQVGNPVTAIQNLLAADHLLASGPKAQKAQYLAKLIKDYGVDIQELDAALAGTAPVDPVESRVEQLLQERLTPFQQYIAQQQQAEQQRQNQVQQTLAGQIAAMSQDPAYPHFEEVRDAMADIIEIQAKRGASIDLKTAYNRAVAADPSISQVIMQTRQAASANAQAQRALQASASVKGAPTGSVAGKPLDRRGQIEAAFAAQEGR
jgi:hypothetical protein